MLTLTNDEFDEIRLLCGVLTRTEELTNAFINSEAINGSASDYVVSQCVISLDISQISAYSTPDAARAATVDSFVAAALNSVQTANFRRAVVYRAAGIAVSILAPVTQEGSNSIITHRREIPKWREVQQYMFEAADQQIAALRSGFPASAFRTNVQSGQGVAGLSSAGLY